MNENDPPPTLFPWELDLIRKVARAFRTPDREELIAELARKLIELKVKNPRDVKSWDAYVAKFLYNKASNWIRQERRRYKYEVELDAASVGSLALLSPTNPIHVEEWSAVIISVWSVIAPVKRRLWMALVTENGNRRRAAERLNVHRNTVSLGVAAIRALLQAYFDEG